ncbi:MAG: ATP-dependent DNA helicase RecG [Pseudobdellovibrionaceae bacterium]|nr:MAG: ATP-dependent DNA helicase RecG [Pseudobdellovibrionaceae bacterium]
MVNIDTQVQYLKGVGPKLGEALRKRGVSTVGDLLSWFPRAYEDRRAARSISTLEPGQIVSFLARIVQVRSLNLGRSHRKIYEVVVADGSGRVSCKYFRVPYKGYFERFQPHQEVRVSGKAQLYRGRLELHHPDIVLVGENEEQEDELIPLYTETEGLRPGKLRRIIGAAIDKVILHPEKPESQIDETLPQWILQKYNLIPRKEALKLIHQPPPHSGNEYIEFKAPAQKRIIFEEFFWLELHLASVRAGVKQEAAPAFSKKQSYVDRLLSQLPFQLTGAQQRAFFDIASDLQRPHPMHRLVQGDVGSGKTMVALMSAVYAVENGYQVALMVPTEILAEQHFKNAQKFLKSLGIKVGLLTGQLKLSEHRQVCEQLASGEIQICVGTHALIQKEVDFKNLGLVIVDEQHRFGVAQRQELKAKGASHFLVMTATPIPRTLAMTVYGDLDVSIIDELPPGRQPILTRKAFENKRPKVMAFVRDQLKAGRQAYVVYPLVEESDKMDLKNAVTEYENLQAEFPEYRLGLLHGKMKPAEKEAVMREFRDGNIDMLVATTVIEVGVDVPNANIMVIEHAERFGLSQLHQLRGRVGRGQHKSYCVLLLGYAVSEDGTKRAEIMEQSTDGFKIAEADLEMRGPGEFLGTRQSGLPGFKMANLVRDVKILQDARQAAFALIQKDPQLTQPEHEKVRQDLELTRTAIIG